MSPPRRPIHRAHPGAPDPRVGERMPEPLRDEDVLVTGATGFLGSHLTRRLVAEGARVHAFVRKDSSLDRLSEAIEALRVWEGDLRDPVSVERCLDGSRPR